MQILKAGSVEKNLLCSILLLNKCNKRQLSLRSENVNRSTQLPNKAVFKGQAKTYTRVTAKCNDETRPTLLLNKAVAKGQVHHRRTYRALPYTHTRVTARCNNVTRPTLLLNKAVA